MSTENTFVNETDRVIVYDDLGESVIHDSLEWAYEESEKERNASFLAEFEVVKGGRYWLANPDDDFYQGVDVIAVIKRRSDSRLFGFQYWTSISKHAEPYIESNGDENGLEFDPPAGFDWDNDYFPHPYVFLPVEPFTITGYKITKEA
ncbi:hypothetical protein [Plantibacter sp. YIM 135249]|uniref:hypothetical protein n=1 Tax=Plantibacter sp. YIM 135249 TaxID=3423918 RepID=UPI003D34D3FC